MTLLALLACLAGPVRAKGGGGGYSSSSYKSSSSSSYKSSSSSSYQSTSYNSYHHNSYHYYDDDDYCCRRRNMLRGGAVMLENAGANGGTDYVHFVATVPLTKADFNSLGEGYKAAIASALGARQNQVSVTGIQEDLGMQCVVGFQLQIMAGRSLDDLRDGKINQELASRGLQPMTLSQLSQAADERSESITRGRWSGGAPRGSFRRCSCGGGDGTSPWWVWLLVMFCLFGLFLLMD
jgi:hypothetical protein